MEEKEQAIEQEQVEETGNMLPETENEPEVFELVSEEEESADTQEAAKAPEAGSDTGAAPESQKEGETRQEGETEDASGEKTETKEKKLFGKKKDKARSKLEEKVAELEDQRVRQLAEFENFRKRSEKEKSQMFEMGARDVIEKILPVIDNFERGLMGIPEDQKEAPFVQGMELVYKQIQTAFEELGVKPIEAVGQEFDPNLHNAVMAVDDDSLESGMIAEELQKGYLYKDSVVRHSMVKVVN